MDAEKRPPDSQLPASPPPSAPRNPDHVPAPRPDRITVVGIGASAGGLAALSQFFAAVPPDTGLTFVVVVHLAPEHESVLADLLQRQSPIPVRQVQGRVQMEPNHVYVIPPGKRLVVSDSYLDLREFEQPQGHRLAIDAFFRSLAEHHGDGAAVILSGTGSDGAVGIQAIKEQGGLILAQQPTEAEYDGMPKSAVATGLVDIVAPATELASLLVAAKRTRAALQLPDEPGELSTVAQHTLSQILAQLQQQTGHDFSGYKQATILRRIVRRMEVVQIDTLSGYLNRMRTDSEEMEALDRDLFIHVTAFFRDSAAWSYLEQEIIPQLFAGKTGGEPVRVWVAGCATGEEAYGIAMLLLEYAAEVANPPPLQIFASDLSQSVLEAAREGMYPQAIAADVSAKRLARFFSKDNSHYRVRPEVRERVLFAQHNLLQDPPFSRLDLILCRNLLIYLTRPVQERVFATFHYALRPNGFLFLGSAESPEGISPLFTPVGKPHRIFRRSAHTAKGLLLPTLSPRHAPNQPALVPGDPTAGGSEDEQHRGLLEELGLPSLLIDKQYAVRHYSETVGRYLQHPAGLPTTDVRRLVRPELQNELQLALQRVFATGSPTHTRPVPVQFNGAPHPVTILVRPSPARGRLLLLFLEQTAADDGSPSATISLPDMQTEELETELQFLRQQLQIMREEYETTVEELRAANEELQSTNEELQSVNQEMRSRVDEMTQANDDLQNLFTATEIATLFLDRGLLVKRYTPRAAKLFNLMPPDRGRPIGHLRANLSYTTLEEDARRVLATLIPVEREVKGDDGCWYLVGLRPYRTQEDKIDGVVITCVDITAGKQAEQAMRDARDYAESIVHTIPDALLVLNTDLRVQSANDTFYTLFKVQPDNTIGACIYDLGNRQWDIPELRILLENILPENNVFLGYEVTHTFEQIGKRTMLVNGRRLDHVQKILLAIVDITEKRATQEQLAAILDQLPVAVGVLDTNGKFLLNNGLMQRYVGSTMPSRDATQVPRWHALDGAGKIVPPDQWPGARALRGERVGDGQEFLLAEETGGEVIRQWLLVSAVPFFGADAALQGAIVVIQDITERKQAEDALRESEERLRTVANLVPDLLWRNDPDGHTTWYNQRWFDYTGQMLEEARSSGWLTTIHPADRKQSLANFRQAIETGQPLRQEHRIRRADGVYHWFLVQALPVYDETGKITQWFGAATDIDELRTAAELLRRRAEEFQAHFHMPNVGNVQIDAQTAQILLTNQSFCNITGYDEAELLMRTPWMLTRAQDRAEIQTRFDELARGERTMFELEKQLVRKDGELRWVMITATVAQHDFTGMPLRIGALVLDITQRKQAEAALHTSEESLRITVESITDYAIITLNAAGIITGWNIGAQQIFGYLPKEAVGQSSSILFTPEDRAQGAPQAEIETARVTGRAADERWHLRKDGTRFYVSGVLTPLQDSSLSGFVKVARDLTQRRQFEEQQEAMVQERTVQVRELITQLTMSEQEERRRISRILHDDLQQLLFGLIFQIHTLRQTLGAGETELSTQIMAEIEETLQHSVHITRELSVDLSPPVLYNEGLVEATRWLANQMQRQHGLTVAVVTHTGLPLLDEDLRVLLFQIVRELLFNVVKHAGVAEAQVALEYRDNAIHITVSDHGKGFDSDPTLAVGQTAQGLQRIRHRLQLLGGGMEIASVSGQGVTITLHCPVQEREEGDKRSGNYTRRRG